MAAENGPFIVASDMAGTQTWLAGKSRVNGGFNGKTHYFYGHVQLC